MTTARQLITEFLKTKSEYVHSSEIHNYLCSAGYKPESSRRILGKMHRDGDVKMKGNARHTHYILCEKPEPAECKVIQRTSTLKKADIATNAVFDDCRQRSWIYAMDQQLRGVRNAATS